MKTFRLVLFGTTFLLMILAAYSSMLIIRRQNATDDLARSEMTWTVTQASTDMSRLEAAIGGYAVEPTSDNADQVRLWLDLVFHRTALLSEGDVARFINNYPEMASAAQSMRDVADAAQPLVDRLGQSGVTQQLLALLRPVNPKLARMSALAYGHTSELTSSDVSTLSRLHWVFSSVLLTLILCSFGLITVTLRDNRTLSRLHRTMGELVEELQRAGADLSRANAVLSVRDRVIGEQNARFDAALSNMSQALCMVDDQRRIIVCNTRFNQLFSLDPGVTQAGCLFDAVLVEIEKAGSLSVSGFESFCREQNALIEARFSSTVSHEDSNGRALAIAHQTMASGGWVATYEEVTERRRAEVRIKYLAHHDALTGLPNRLTFQDRLDELLSELQPGGSGFAVLCLDLDHFKIVNDTLGHPAGDLLLEIVAKRLASTIRDGDLIARLGGDEFAILQLSDDAERAANLAQRVVETIGQPYDLAGQRALVSASVGIAIAQVGMSAVKDVFKHADMALYEAKRAGRAGFSFFADEMNVRLQARREIELDLRDAQRNGELEVFYQPLVDLISSDHVGFEALLRWRHPVRGMVSPAEFIPIAEELSLIEEMGRFVLRQACMEATDWPAHLRVSVNLSPLQFKGEHVMQSVTDALRDSGLSPARLELEVTESVLLLESDSVLKTLHDVRALGVHITLDDFGTGYSSLSYLRSFPFEKIKIDQSFIREMETRPDCRSIVNAITSLARELGMRTTAEGVETAWQLDQVRQAGCNEGQGYLYSRPMPATEVSSYLSQLREPRILAFRAA